MIKPQIPVFSIIFLSLLSTLTSYATTHVVTLDDGWKFKHGPVVNEYFDATYDDSDWKDVRVPHDWAISEPFDETVHGSTGKLPWKGIACYRRQIEVSEIDADKRIYLDFDGVMAFPKVYLNGELVGQWDYGYTPFRVDLSGLLKSDVPNELLVEVDTRKLYSRWYPGAGIYRKVQLVTSENAHIAQWGTFVSLKDPQKLDTIRIESTVENYNEKTLPVTLALEVFNSKGERIGKTEYIPLTLKANAKTTSEVDLSIPHPIQWDVDHPYLYTLKSQLMLGDAILDQNETRFGLRTIQFTANDGFFLNGRRVQLKGVNLHHDLGPLGAAFNRRAAQRQLEIMGSMGVNALRTSHNPPAAEVLDLCDEMGILVWDETYDKWYRTAGRDGSEKTLKEHGTQQITANMMRDRNHPSVIVWSIGNEILEGENGITPDNVAMMVGIAKSIDTTRPIGLGCHIPSMSYHKNFDKLDLTGWNYARRYSDFRKVYPNKPIWYSESASTVSTRGYYSFPLPVRHTDYLDSLQVSSYDLTSAPWSDIPDVEFKLMEDDTYVHGEFVWTGFDYIGEPTPYDAQARSSYFGIVDLCGFEKDRYFLYKSHWKQEENMVHILPHWNWPDRVEKNVPVFVYTNGDSAELFLNEKSLGMRHKGIVPDKVPNLAHQAIVQASSTAENSNTDYLIDSDANTVWSTAEADGNQWLILNFKKSTQMGYVGLHFEKQEKHYAYTLLVSEDGELWETLLTKNASNTPRWGGPQRIFHEIKAQGRYLKIQFTEIAANEEAPRFIALRNLAIYSEPRESDYFNVTYNYRLRWNEVAYEPGELKAVAYLHGKVVGEKVIHTAGEPEKIQLTTDRTELNTTGEDLAFITVEAYDTDDVLCPNADSLIHFELKGPGIIAGVGNGNPLSFEPFQADYRTLFNGKALLIVRALKGETGKITITAKAEGLETATIVLNDESSAID